MLKGLISQGMFRPQQPPRGKSIQKFIEFINKDTDEIEKIPIVIIDSDSYRDGDKIINMEDIPKVDVRIVYSHGNGQDLHDIYTAMKDLISRLSMKFDNDKRFDYRVLCICWDYPGYSYNYGKHKGNEILKRVSPWALAVNDYTRNYKNPERFIGRKVKKVNIVWGYSIGTGPTCFLAVNEPYPDIVYLHSPYKSIKEISPINDDNTSWIKSNIRKLAKNVVTLDEWRSGICYFNNEENIKKCRLHSKTYVIIEYAKNDDVVQTPKSLRKLADKVYKHNGGHDIFNDMVTSLSKKVIDHIIDAVTLKITTDEMEEEEEEEVIGDMIDTGNTTKMELEGN